MNKKIKILIGIIILLIVLVVGIVVFVNNLAQNNETINIESDIKSYVILVIDSGDGNPKALSVELEQGKTAFDALKNGAEGAGILIKTQNYDIGVLITSIGGIENGKDGKYWIYYVNGESAQVAADKKEVKAGDKIEFKFEKSIY